MEVSFRAMGNTKCRLTSFQVVDRGLAKAERTGVLKGKVFQTPRLCVRKDLPVSYINDQKLGHHRKITTTLIDSDN